MPASPTCPDCGRALPSGAKAGTCPACLLRIGLALGNAGFFHDLDGGEEALPDGPDAPSFLRRVGDYELLEEIGRGGMGVVYKARQVSLNRFVALKLVRAGELASEAEVARFHDEARAAAHLDHPSLVPIYEVGEHDGRHYFSMKLVEGGSLAQRIASDEWPTTNERGERVRPPFDLRHSAFVVSRVVRAIHYAHQRGILHRDLKPGNILLDPDDCPHVTDFGLARRLGVDSSITMSGAIVGTPGYLAPEQAAGAKQLTVAADIYSLGAILYELLAGRPPFTGATVMEILQKVIHDEPEPPGWVRGRRKEAGGMQKASGGGTEPAAASAFRDLEVVCLKCLEKDPARRYGSAEALAEDLERWLRGEPILARPVTFFERWRMWVRRRPAIAALAGLALMFGVAGLAGVLWQWRAAAAARLQLRDELWQSNLNRARAERQTLSLGRLGRSLDAIRAAAAVRATAELRDEAVAALAMTDLRDTGVWRPHPLDSGWPEWALDPQLGHLALSSPDAVELWNIPENRSAAYLSHEGKNTRFMRFSPDGRALAVKYFNRDFVVWDLLSREPRFTARLRNEPREEDSMFGFDFSADGRWVGTSDFGGLFLIYDAHSGELRTTLSITNAARHLQMARFNPRTNWLAIAAGNLVEVWSTTGQRLAQRTNLLNAARLAWHPDGVVLALVNWFRPEIVLWNIRTGSERVLHSGHGSQIYLSFAPQGDLLATRGTDNATRLWDLATGQKILGTEMASSLDFDDSGTRLSYDRQNSGVGLWEVVRSPVFQSVRHPEASESVAFQTHFLEAGNKLIWRAADGIYHCDLQTGRMHRGPLGWTSSMDVDDDAGALWATTLRGLTRWEGLHESAHSPGKVFLPGDQWLWAGLAVQGRRLAVGTDTNLTVYALPEFSPVFSTTSLLPKAWAISADGVWLASVVGEKQDEVVVYDLREGAEAARLRRTADSLLFDPSGRWLVLGSVDGCRFLEIGSWREARHFPRQAPNGIITPMAFSPDGRWFAHVRAPGILSLAESETGHALASLEAPVRLQLRGIAFSPDGKSLAAAAENGSVQLWRLDALERELAALGLSWNSLVAFARALPVITNTQPSQPIP